MIEHIGRLLVIAGIAIIGAFLGRELFWLMVWVWRLDKLAFAFFCGVALFVIGMLMLAPEDHD